MRILQINSVDGRGGGATRMAMALHKAYLADGHDAHLLVGKKVTSEPNVHALLSPFRLFGKRTEAAYLSYAEYLTGYQGRFSHALKRWQAHNTGNWDVIHCHNLHGGGYISFSDLQDIYPNIPMILTLHDLWMCTGHCAAPMNCKGYLTGCGQCSQLGTTPQVRIDKTNANAIRKKEFVHKRKPTIVGVSKWTSQTVAESHLKWPCETIYNGIDLNQFHPIPQKQAREKLGLPEECKIALYIVAGGLSRTNRFDHKSPELVLDAAAMVHTQLETCGIKFRLLTVGGISEDNNIPDYIIQQKSIDTGIDQYYSAADVTVHASKSDTFGLTLAESMACGTPVVTTNAGGCPEVAGSDTNNRITPQGDIPAFAEAVAELLMNANDKPDISLQQRVEQMFSLDKMANSYLELYQKLHTKIWNL